MGIHVTDWQHSQGSNLPVEVQPLPSTSVRSCWGNSCLQQLSSVDPTCTARLALSMMQLLRCVGTCTCICGVQLLLQVLLWLQLWLQLWWSLWLLLQGHSHGCGCRCDSGWHCGCSCSCDLISGCGCGSGCRFACRQLWLKFWLQLQFQLRLQMRGLLICVFAASVAACTMQLQLCALALGWRLQAD